MHFFNERASGLRVRYDFRPKIWVWFLLFGAVSCPSQRKNLKLVVQIVLPLFDCAGNAGYSTGHSQTGGIR